MMLCTDGHYTLWVAEVFPKLVPTFPDKRGALELWDHLTHPLSIESLAESGRFRVLDGTFKGTILRGFTSFDGTHYFCQKDLLKLFGRRAFEFQLRFAPPLKKRAPKRFFLVLLHGGKPVAAIAPFLAEPASLLETR